ncbi:hypothetical protein WISP_91055 [Willisornis vidua]|uniref:Uncharacterized protein n=1 Tax=Willisornis vidua TaxID=1566151 RepID=A0ABQ9D1M8_9PASS|nr:hypothetical protein WISP_91055 [Willisornis vidua]
MVLCGLWMLQQNVVPKDMLCRSLWSCAQPTVCQMELMWRIQEEEEKKFEASAKQMPSAGLQEAVWLENCLAEPLAQQLCLPPLANFHKLLWNAGGCLELWAVSSALQPCGEDLNPTAAEHLQASSCASV